MRRPGVHRPELLCFRHNLCCEHPVFLLLLASIGSWVICDLDLIQLVKDGGIVFSEIEAQSNPPKGAPR
jgi:hypothetical protein